MKIRKQTATTGLDRNAWRFTWLRHNYTQSPALEIHAI
jgi:hypothetical protein